MNKDPYYKKAIAWVKNKSPQKLKASIEGYESPKAFINKSTEEEVQADIAFSTTGGFRHYTDIALKTDKVQKLVTRWKLLSIMAKMKRGKLHLLAPKGHKMFTERLVDKYNIDAMVYRL